MTDQNGRLTTYDLGQGVSLVFSFKDRNGSAADPPTVTVEVQRQGDTGLWNTYTYGASGDPIQRDGLGSYHVDFLPDRAGYWEWEASGVGMPNTEPVIKRGVFYVAPGEPNP